MNQQGAIPFLIVVFTAVFLWWLLIRTEGVYLGKRVVICLYDLYASRYDRIVQNDEVDEHIYLAQPLMERLELEVHPMVLDAATGTGRLPMALCQHPHFEGHIVAVDLSRHMLAQAALKITSEHFDDYVTLIWADSTALPFDDDYFDVVTCLEALEFLPDPARGLQELVRVLRPGGLLLTTRRINEPMMPGRLWTEPEMIEILEMSGIGNIEFESWQYDYTKAWGIKQGHSLPQGAEPLDGRIICPCGRDYLANSEKSWICPTCLRTIPVSDDGVIQWIAAQPRSGRVHLNT